MHLDLDLPETCVTGPCDQSHDQLLPEANT